MDGQRKTPRTGRYTFQPIVNLPGGAQWEMLPSGVVPPRPERYTTYPSGW
jgi:hypothetical protein